MTYQEALEYRTLREKMAVIKEQLAIMDAAYYIIAGEPEAQRQARNELHNRLNGQLVVYETQEDAFMRWLSAVPDRLIQTYMYMRFVDGLTWAQIGAKMNCKPCTARKAVQRYMKREAQRNGTA